MSFQVARFSETVFAVVFFCFSGVQSFGADDPLCEALLRGGRSARSQYSIDVSKLPVITADEMASIAAQIHEQEANIARVALSPKLAPIVTSYLENEIDAGHIELPHIFLGKESLEKKLAALKAFFSKARERQISAGDIEKNIDELSLKHVFFRKIVLFFKERAGLFDRPIGIDDSDLSQLLGCASKIDELRNRIVAGNLRIALKYAQRYKGRGVSEEDLIQAANIGLITAAERYELKVGIRFSTFAAIWIRAEIQGTILETGRMVQLPRWVEDQLGKISKVRAGLIGTLKREPTIEEIAAAFEQPIEDIAIFLNISLELVSLEKPLSDSSELTLKDQIIYPDAIDPENAVSCMQGYGFILRSLAALKENEREIIKLHHGLDDWEEYSLPEIAKKKGVGPRCIQINYSKALKKIKELYFQRF